MARHVLASKHELKENTSRLFHVAGRAIAVFNVNGEFFALNNRCPHEGASLCHGKLVSLVRSSEPGKYEVSRPNEMLQCSWHGWEFDIRTGQSWCSPSRVRAKSYAVSVRSGEELVKGPYMAETFNVMVEGEYLVIDI